MNWSALELSLRVTVLAGVVITLLGLAIAYVLARRRFRGKLLLETLVMLPLVLPPSVLGYYLLFVLGRGSFLKETLGIDVLFTWWAAVFAAVVVGLPLMIQSAKAGFAGVEREIEDAARADGANSWQVLAYITLPIARPAVLAGVILSSARALGEFGATLMVAGNIPNRTQTLPLAIYDAVQSRDYALANGMVLVITAVAFVGLWGVYRFLRDDR